MVFYIFSDKFEVKPSRIGSISLKIPHLADYVLKDVLYIPQFQQNLMSLVHIRQQGYSIHIFYGIIEICRESDNSVIMTGVKEGTLLKLNNTPSTTHSTLLVQQNNLLPSSLLWH